MPVRVLDDHLDPMPLMTPNPSIDHKLIVKHVSADPKP